MAGRISDYAYFELEATWDPTGGVLEAPSITRQYPAVMYTDWDAQLQLTGDRVEVAISQDGADRVKFTAIRAIF